MSRRKKVELELKDGILHNKSSGKQVDKEQIYSDSNTDYIITNVDESNELAVGLALNQYNKTSTSFLDDLKDFKELEDIYKQMEICHKMFILEDVVSTAIDIFTDLVITPFEIEGVEGEAKELLENWSENLNRETKRYQPFGLHRFVKDMAYEWFISGNIFPWEVWENKSINTKVRSIPNKLKLLNPRTIRIDATSLMAGNPKYTLHPGLINNKLNLSDIVAEINGGVRNNPLFKSIKEKNMSSGLPLSNDFLSHIKRRARDYDVWGIPYLTKVVQSVAYKHKLRRLDVDTIDGLINMVTIFKIGSDNPNSKYHDVVPSRLKAFHNILKSPQATTMLVWPHDIDVITTGPDGKILEFSDKYKDANIDIIRGLGIPPVLLDGAGNVNAAWISIISLIERLENAREDITNYLMHLMIKVCEENGFEDEKPQIRWAPTKLRDERTIKTLLLAFYDRGLLPIEIMHQEGGYNHDEMVKLKELEERLGLSEKFKKPQVPFDSPNNQPNNNNNFNRPGNEGRPVDNTDDKDKSNTSTATIEDQLYNKFLEDLILSLSVLEDNIIDLERRNKSDINSLVNAQILKMNQIAYVYGSFDFPDIDPTMEAKLINWFSIHLDSLRKYIVSNVSKISSRKIVKEEKDIFIKGIFSNAKKRATMFVKESDRKVRLSKKINYNKKRGKAGAIFKSSADTKCDTCKTLNGNFITMDDLFDIVPVHPNSRFDLEFLDSNPVLEGKSKNDVMVKNPKNKSKTL